MSQELMLEFCYTDKNRSPDFKKVRGFISKLKKHDIGVIFAEDDGMAGNLVLDLEGETIGAVRETMREDLRILENAWTGRGGRRDLSFSMPKYGIRVLVTGDMSYGDSPSELFDAIARLRGVGALKVGGFCDE